MAKHNVLGTEGEVLAFHFLKSDGFIILETNWRWEKGKIDIYYARPNHLSFSRSKTKSNEKFENPEEAITNKKQCLMQDAAEA